MANKKHELTPDKILIKQIDETIPRLKYSVSFLRIIRWLENFESHEVDQALDFLFYLEFIDFAELTYRINEQLEKAFKEIPKVNNVLIFPAVQKYPKSPEVINYLISKTPIFEKNSGRTIIFRDISIIAALNTDTSIILTDDFIGSGFSFRDGYDTKSKLKKNMDENVFVKQRFLVSAIIMDKGQDLIKKKYPEVKIYAEPRNSIFHNVTSPFNLKGNTNLMQNLAIKYGDLINGAPLGYNGTEALIAFSHTCPNNSLSIIWGSNKWHPIFPRFAKDNIAQSMQLKKEAAYYIGIMNRLGLDLYSDMTIRIGPKNGRDIKYNSKKDHSLICVIKLLKDGYEMPFICQILGITIGEYELIIKYGKLRGLLDMFGNIHPLGLDFFNRLTRKAGPKRFINKTKEIFQMKFLNYVPKSFGGES